MTLSPRLLALTITLAGFTLAQGIVNQYAPKRPPRIAVAQAEPAVATSNVAIAGDATTALFIPSAKNPQEKVNRVEIYHAPPFLRSRDEILTTLNLTVYPEDQVQFLPDPSLGLGSQITVTRAIPIMIDNGGNRTYHRTFKGSVKEFLDERGILLGAKDIIDPALEAELWWGGRVIITRVEDGEYMAVEDIPYNVQTRGDSNMFKDETKVIREGKPGRREVKLQVRTENGREVSREVLSERVLTRPATKVVVQGTKVRPASGRWEDLINEIAPRYFADPVGIMKIMMCESGGNLTSYNPAGPYYGMFQFDEYTFTRIAGHSMSEIEDARAQIDGAAKLYSARFWHWPVCSRGT